MSSPITTHVLDTANGRPAKGIAVTLEFQDDDQWTELASGITDDDGRISDLLSDDEPPQAGVYRITFEIGSYFDPSEGDGFYPSAPVVFQLADTDAHYHVPLLLSPYGYSTYRGS